MAFPLSRLLPMELVEHCGHEENFSIGFKSCATGNDTAPKEKLI